MRNAVIPALLASLVSLLALLAMETQVHAAPPPTFQERFIAAAHERTQHSVAYDGRYLRLDYPGGDVPDTLGVCTDVIIRAYRAVGIDLQEAVHEDMREHFAAYPKIWGLSRPDPNIDHRRVPNLRTFFTRTGLSLPPSNDPDDYLPGDLVTWSINNTLPHIGIIVERRSRDRKRPLIVHNVGRGPKLEDVLFAYPVTGHYRFGPESQQPTLEAAPNHSRPIRTGSPSH